MFLKKISTYSIVALSTILLVACGGSGSDSNSSSKNNNEPKSPISDNSDKIKDKDKAPVKSAKGCGNGITQKAMLDKINNTRKTGRYCSSTFYPATHALKWNGKLAKAAVNYADEMATYNFFSHTSKKDGRTFTKRIKDAGYKNYSYVSENIAAGQRSVPAVFESLLDSDGHCENIMSPKIKDFGMACAKDTSSDYTYYWVQKFGAQ